MGEFRAQAHRLLADREMPQTLWVVHSEGTRAMIGPRDGPHLDLGGHYDWLLAAGPTQLGLFRLRGPLLHQGDLVFRSDYGPLEVAFTDAGGLARARHIAVTGQDGSWFSVTAHLTPMRAERVNQFTDLLLNRVGASGGVRDRAPRSTSPASPPSGSSP